MPFELKCLECQKNCSGQYYGGSFGSLISLEAHLVKEHFFECFVHQCPICPFAYFPSEQTLISHFQQSHEGVDRIEVKFINVEPDCWALDYTSRLHLKDSLNKSVFQMLQAVHEPIKTEPLEKELDGLSINTSSSSYSADNNIVHNEEGSEAASSQAHEPTERVDQGHIKDEFVVEPVLASTLEKTGLRECNGEASLVSTTAAIDAFTKRTAGMVVSVNRLQGEQSKAEVSQHLTDDIEQARDASVAEFMCGSPVNNHLSMYSLAAKLDESNTSTQIENLSSSLPGDLRVQKSRSSSENVEENLAERSTELVLHQPQTLVKKRKRSMANSQNVIGKKKKLSEKKKKKEDAFLAMTEKTKCSDPNVSEDSLNLTLSPLDLNLSHDQQASNVSSGPENSLLTSEETSPSPSSRKDATYQDTEQSDQSQDTSEDFVLKRSERLKKLHVSAEQDVAGQALRLQQLKPGYKQPHRSPSRSLLEKQSSDDEDFPLEEILAEHVVNGEIKYLLAHQDDFAKLREFEKEERKKVEKEAVEKAKKEAEKQTARAAKLAAASALAKRPRASSCNRVAKSILGAIVLLKTRNQNNQKKDASTKRFRTDVRLSSRKRGKSVKENYSKISSSQDPAAKRPKHNVDTTFFWVEHDDHTKSTKRSAYLKMKRP
uniref:C2H2-type domain-containing protein n=1 Tax=Ditylenchus dipsaci TaxID=166011 RepID=A0A915D1F8_9BILA